MTEVWQSTATAASVVAILATSWALIACTRRLGRLRREGVESARRIDALTVRVRRLESQAALKPESEPASKRDPSRRRLDPPANSVLRGPTLIAVPSLASSGSEAVASKASAELGRRFGTIWMMADAGESLDAISRATGHPLGQVELILGLRRPTLAASTSELHEGSADA